MSLQVPWVNSLADGLTVKDMETLRRIVIALRQKLEASDGEPI